MTVHVAAFESLDARTLHDIIRLRVEVFVVEQHCAYAEIDGRDVESGTRHLWVSDDGTVVGYLRLLAEDDGTRRIGRVCVARAHRGRGLAAQLVTRALEECRDDVVVLEAQSHLEEWYEHYGFARSGPGYVEDGIPHVPMRRPPPLSVA